MPIWRTYPAGGGCLPQLGCPLVVIGSSQTAGRRQDWGLKGTSWFFSACDYEKCRGSFLQSICIFIIYIYIYICTSQESPKMINPHLCHGQNMIKFPIQRVLPCPPPIFIGVSYSKPVRLDIFFISFPTWTHMKNANWKHHWGTMPFSKKWIDHQENPFMMVDHAK